MDRSRSKRNYYYDQDYDSETLARTRPRYNHHYSTGGNNNHRHRGGGAARHAKTQQDSPLTVTTSYRILCHDMKAGGVIGKSGTIIKSIRQHTGAWINVHELMQGDEERIIEISDTRRRDPDGRMPSFSPAQEALLLIHERILESDAAFGVPEDDEEYGGGGGRGGGGGGRDRVATRLVVSRMHVGCLLGKGGKIIEQMRMETKTQIRILPRDHNLPRCVSMSEEIVQVVGDVNAVKNALVIISSRLRESQHRDRSHFHGRPHSPERFFSPDDDYVPHVTSGSRRSSVDGATFGSRGSNTNSRNNNHPSLSYAMEPGAAPVADDAQGFYGEEIVFRILCPVEKVDLVIGESDGIVEFLQNEVGVDVKVIDPVGGSAEQIIIITSEEGPDDELFPAQEALLHIQSRIVDLVLDKDNTITTRLVVPSSEIECLDGKDVSLSEIRRLTGAHIQILPREELPLCVAKTDELVQPLSLEFSCCTAPTLLESTQNAVSPLPFLVALLHVHSYWSLVLIHNLCWTQALSSVKHGRRNRGNEEEQQKCMRSEECGLRHFLLLWVNETLSFMGFNFHCRWHLINKQRFRFVEQNLSC